MAAHLYLVEHEVLGECYTAPVVGEEELEAHVNLAATFGASLLSVKDVEVELHRFVWDCCFEGRMKNWLDA